MFDSLPLVLILLVSSVLLVGLFRYLKLPAMIAYFIVGLILGPHVIGVLPDSESSRHFAEFGIVFLMFSIGLEFSLPKLYSMRNILFGLGGAWSPNAGIVNDLSKLHSERLVRLMRCGECHSSSSSS